MKEQKRRQSLSGAVLIMVITVMVVLLIMLMATLTVVTTANRRIATKFEENQAYYTARSALDVFTQSMLIDKQHYSDKSNAGDTSNKVKDDFEVYLNGNGDANHEMTQGLAMQLDIYALGSKDGENVDQHDLYNYAHSKSGSDDAKDQYLYYFGTSLDSSGNPENTVLTYEVWLPQVSGNSDGNFGRLSDDFNSLTPTGVKAGGGKATIKVEVIDRHFDLGTYTDGGTAKEVTDDMREDFFDPANYSLNKGKIAEAIFNGNRKKDTMRIKVTATAEFEGNLGTAVLYYDTQEPPQNNSSRAITSFGSVTGTNHMYIVGGISMQGDLTDDNGDGIPDKAAPVTNGGGVFGTLYDEIGIDYNVATPTYLTEMEYVYVGGDFKSQNNVNIAGAVSDTDIAERPFIYVGGIMQPNNNFTGIGGTTANEKVDIIVKNGIKWEANSFGINGNIYSGDDCTFNSTAGTPDIKGNLYIDGDLYVGGNCLTTGVNNTLNFGTNCKVFVSGKVYNTANGAEIPLTSLYNQGNVTNVGSFTANNLLKNKLPTYNDIYDTSTGNADFTMDFSSLPESAGVKRKIDTRKTNYDDYYAIDETTGDYLDITGPSGVPDGVVPDHMPVTDIAGIDFTDPANLPSDNLDDLNNNNMTIDTSDTTVPTQYVLHGGINFNGKTLTIKGGGTVEIYLKKSDWNSNYSSGNGQLDVIVADDTTLKVYGADKDIEYNFDKVRFWTETTYDAYKNGTQIDAGSQTGHNIKVPKIYYYFSGGKVILSNGENFFTGYFFAPETVLYSGAESNMKFSNLKYNGAAVPSNWVYDFFGSVLVGDFEFQNDHGVVYVNPKLEDDGNAGEPIHNWSAYQYARY